jgi:hypothetical protein
VRLRRGLLAAFPEIATPAALSKVIAAARAARAIAGSPRTTAAAIAPSTSSIICVTDLCHQDDREQARWAS